MFKYLKSIFSDSNQATSDFQLGESISQIATMNSINKRQNTRVTYPHIGAIGELPKVTYNGQVMTVKNISLGGLCALDIDSHLTLPMGSDFQLNLEWPDLKIEVPSTLVGSAEFRRHIQFKDLDTKAYVKLSLILKPGFIGSKFYKVNDALQEANFDELWIGPTGENLTFNKCNHPSEHYAEMLFNRAEVLFHHEQFPVYKSSSDKWQKGQRVSKHIYDDILITLSNFQSPTIRVKRLIEQLGAFAK